MIKITRANVRRRVVYTNLEGTKANGKIRGLVQMSHDEVPNAIVELDKFPGDLITINCHCLDFE